MYGNVFLSDIVADAYDNNHQAKNSYGQEIGDGENNCDDPGNSDDVSYGYGENAMMLVIVMVIWIIMSVTTLTLSLRPLMFRTGGYLLSSLMLVVLSLDRSTRNIPGLHWEEQNKTMQQIFERTNCLCPMPCLFIRLADPLALPEAALLYRHRRHLLIP